MSWMARLDALDYKVAVGVHRLFGTHADTVPDYDFTAEDCIVLRVGRRHRFLLAAAVVLVAIGALIAFVSNAISVLPGFIVTVVFLLSHMGTRVQLDASGVTYKNRWFPVGHTPWDDVEEVVAGPWPAMWRPHVLRHELPRRVPLRGWGLETTGGDPVVYACTMAQQHGVPVIKST
ncbi:hypothetical protein BH23ACT9_BH23ACT9_15040 [soil metagenome]